MEYLKQQLRANQEKYGIDGFKFDGADISYMTPGEYDFYDIWLDKLKVYRINNKNKCKRADCPSHKQCRGCCSYYPEITTCYVG